MSSTTRLLVLGVVRIFQPVHGYDVRRELLSWRAHEWASIKSGSIYNALKTLAHDGLLAVVGTDQVGGRPERTTYKLTPAGEDEFRILLHAEWWTVRTPTDPLMAAISFIGYVKRDEAIAALEHRSAQVHSAVRHIASAADGLDGIESPYHVREMHGLLIARLAAEVAWAKQLVARLRNGEYITADDPPWQPVSEQAGGAAATLGNSARRGKYGAGAARAKARDKPERLAAGVAPPGAGRRRAGAEAEVTSGGGRRRAGAEAGTTSGGGRRRAGAEAEVTSGGGRRRAVAAAQATPAVGRGQRSQRSSGPRRKPVH